MATNANDVVESVEMLNVNVPTNNAEEHRSSNSDSRPVPCRERFLQDAATVFSIALLTYFGVALRLGLIDLFQSFHTDEYDAVFHVLYANFIGSFIIALAVDHKGVLARISEHFLFALQAGFCGSLTSFSSVMVSGSKVIFGFARHDTTLYERAFIFLENVFFNFLVSFLFFCYGRHLSHRQAFKQFLQNLTSTNSDKFTKLNFPIAILIVYTAVSILLLLISVFYIPSRRYSMAMLFGQVASLSRFFICKQLNARHSNFPAGTFIVNVIGSGLSATLACLTLYIEDFDSVSLIVITSLASGFCGSLTTVSSFISELALLPNLFRTVIYALASLICAQFFAIIPFIAFNIKYSRELYGSL